MNLTNVNLRSSDAAETKTLATIPSLLLKADNGKVRITLPEGIVMEGQHDAAIKLTSPDLEIVASGDLDDLTYDFGSQSITMDTENRGLSREGLPDEENEIYKTVTQTIFSGVSGQRSTKKSDGDKTAGALNILVNNVETTSNGPFEERGSLSITNLKIEEQDNMPIAALIKMRSRMSQPDYRYTVTDFNIMKDITSVLKVTADSAKTMNSNESEGRSETTIRPWEGQYNLSNGVLSVTGTVNRITDENEMFSSFPVSYTAEKSGFMAEIPLGLIEGRSQIKLTSKTDGINLAESTWEKIDAGKDLPRTPGEFEINITAEVVPALEKGEAFDVSAIRVDKMRGTLAGVTGDLRGDVLFPSGMLGAPSKANFSSRIEGYHAFLDVMAKNKAISVADLGKIKHGISMFFKETEGQDVLTSDVEFGDGSFKVNGAPMR